MKRTATLILGILQLMITFVSCNDSDIQEQASGDRNYVSVMLNTMIPLVELPSSRAISDDSAIDSYALWVFSNGQFLEAIYPGDTYNGENRAELSGTNLSVLLPDGLSNVTLAMIANVGDIQSQEPPVGRSLADANAIFTGTDATRMPMYGTSNPFDVAYGANGGNIVLYRAMAKVEVLAAGAIDHFKLKEMHVYHTNAKGSVKKLAEITNEGEMQASVQGVVDENSNSASIYLAEINLSSMSDTRTFVILQGEYTSLNGEITTRWYKLDFIQQEESTDKVIYTPLENIRRNFKYVFDIQYLTEGTGYTTLEETVNGEASNKISQESTELIVIHDEEIMDITTNNYLYLGVTAGQVKTSEGNQYHVANVSIVTNNPQGWSFEALPEGVSVSIPQYKGDSSMVEVISVWVYLDKTKYTSGQSVTIYVYGDNIRKSITVTVP